MSEQEYENTHAIWKLINCTSLFDLAEVYLRADVAHLTDVFQTYRKVSLKDYKLDPCFFYTGPGLAMKSLLAYTKREIELFTDVDMVRFISRSIRGGITNVSHRYVKNNNKYMKDYNPNMPSSHTCVFDVNALYSYAMMQNMPTGAYRWEDNPSTFDIYSIDLETSSRGYVLECDIFYPRELHDVHNYLPFLPKQKKVPGSNTRKLICDF